METLAPVYERLFIECGDSLFVPNGIKWSGTMSASGITWGSSPFLEFMGSPELSFIAKERNATKAEEVNENLAAKSTTIAFVTAEAVRTFDFRPGPMASDAIDLTRLNGTDILGGSLTSPYRQDGSAVPTNAFVGFDLNTRTLRDGTQKIELDFGRFSVFAPEDFKEERENILPATFEHIIRNKSRLVPIGCSDLRNPVIYAAKFALLKDPNGAELALAEKFFSWFTRGSGVDAKSQRNAFESAGVRSDLLTPTDDTPLTAEDQPEFSDYGANEPSGGQKEISSSPGVLLPLAGSIPPEDVNSSALVESSRLEEAKPDEEPMSPAPAAEQAGPPLPAVPPKGPTAESARRIIDDYPTSALRAKQEGDVTLSMCVSAEGRATDVKVIRSSGVKVLDDAAIRAVPKLRFTPGTDSFGKPVAWCTPVYERFQMTLGWKLPE